MTNDPSWDEQERKDEARKEMRHERKFWCAGVCISWLLASASAVDAYTYRIGPNYVNMSGARCHTATAAGDANLSYSAGSVTVVNTTSTRQLFCPIQRRNTTFYGNTSGSNLDLKVGGDYITVRAADQSSLQKLSCFNFASGMGSGATFFGGTTFLCATSGGCSSVASSFTGTNTIRIPTPYSLFGQQTVNWGLVCNVPRNSTIYYTESSIWPNDTF